MTKARDTANLVATGVPNSLITLDAAEIPNISTDKLTSGTLPDARIADLAATKLTGTIADARISEASVTQHVTATDLSGVNADITALALREATNESSAAFNLPNKFIETFTDDTNLGTQTTVDRVSGYVSSIYSTGSAVTTSTLVGSAVRSSAQSKFGGYSLDTTNNNGSNNDSWLQTGNLTSITNSIGTGNWTIDFWFKYSQRDGTDRFFGIGNTSNTAEPIMSMGYNSSTSMNFYYYQTNVNVTFPTQDTSWHHYALQRDGGTVYVWCDGVYKSSFSFSANLMSGNDLFIGRRHANANECAGGYFDEFRISNNKRYTNSSNFTPETTAYSIDANTVLLWHFDENPIAEGHLVSNSSATGTLIQSANTVGSAKTVVGGTILYKDNAGTTTLGTDLKIYFSCNNGGAWTEAASYNAITPVYSTGIKQVRLGETTCTSGTGVIYKAVWANQASGSKETQLHGIGINY
jgi:hypothetical protein